MDAFAGLAAVGVMSAAGTGFLLGGALADRRTHRRRAQALLSLGDSSPTAWLQWRLRRGIAPLRPVSEALLRRPFVRRYVQWIQLVAEERKVAAPQASLLSCLIGLCLACVGLGWVVAGSPVFGCAAAGCLVVALGGYAKSEAERRESVVRDEIPDALRSLGVCFRAGLSLMQTLRQTGTEMKGPLGEVFLAAARILETGGTASEALLLFKQRSDTPELAFVAVALDVQHQSGGSLAHVLDAARESVEGEIELVRSLKVQTAQAKLSARIVTLMPFVLIALFSLMSPGFLTPFFSSFGGLALLVVALVMQAGGVLLVHRMLDVGVG